jgi:hypothetical protein
MMEAALQAIGWAEASARGRKRPRNTRPIHESSSLIIKVYEKHVPPGTVFRDLEEIHNTLESTLSG